MYDQLVMLISNVGFPIAISLYLLLRIEKKLEELTKALNSLDKSILSAIEHQKDEYFTRKWDTHFFYKYKVITLYFLRESRKGIYDYKNDCVKFKDNVCFFINTINRHKTLFNRYFMLNYEKYILKQ